MIVLGLGITAPTDQGHAIREPKGVVCPFRNLGSGDTGWPRHTLL